MTLTADRFLIVAGIMSLALLLLTVGLIAALRARAKTSTDEPPRDSTGVPNWLISPADATGKTARNGSPPIDSTDASDFLKSLAGAAGKTLTGSAGANLPAEAIVVLREVGAADWVVEVNGLRYQNLKDIHDDKAATKVLAAIGGLQRFAGAIPIMTPPPAVEKPAGESGTVVLPGNAPKLEPVIVAALAHASPSTKSKYPAPAGSILDQIEKVLQQNLIKDPALAQRRIHIGAAADGSLLIEVDWNTYKSADDMPDDYVRNVIKTSIQEWERTPDR
jgi:hypothetical protein